MKKYIACFLIAALLISLSGCTTDIDGAALQNQISQLIFPNRPGSEGDSSDTRLVMGFEPEAGKNCRYNLEVTNENRTIHLRCRIHNKYLVSPKLTREEFNQLVFPGSYSDEDLHIIYHMYLAQNSAMEIMQLVQILQSINSKDKEYQIDYTETMGTWINEVCETTDSIISVAEDVGDFDHKDFLRHFLDEHTMNLIETTDAVKDGLETVVDSYRMVLFTGQLMEDSMRDEVSNEKSSRAISNFLDSLNIVMKTDPLMDAIYSSQIETLKTSCLEYLESYNQHIQGYKHTSHIADGAVSTHTEDIFRMSSADGTAQWNNFISYITNSGDSDNIESYWGAEYMPTAYEVILKLSNKPENQDKTVYELIGIDDTLNQTDFQFWIAQYVEFRVLYEFKLATGISFETYYNLMKPEKEKLFIIPLGESFDTAPWEKVDAIECTCGELGH